MTEQNNPESVAIIGAGMAGLTCATSLQLNVPEVVVFEQAVHPGGRMASQRVKGIDFDAGLQYFTVQDERFSWSVESWQEEGLAAPWDGWFADLDHGNFLRRDESIAHYVSVPNMTALPAHMAALCQVEFGCRIRSIRRKDDQWQLEDQFGRDLGSFDQLVLAVPPRVARELLSDIDTRIKAQLEQATMTHTWSLLMAFEESTGLLFDAAYVSRSPLDWVARNNSKPGRGERESWVAVATPEWAEQYVNYSDEEVEGLLFEAFDQAVGGLMVKPVIRELKYWPDGKAVHVAGEECLYDDEIGLGLCGDWCIGSRLEAAFISGLSMAGELSG